MKFSEWKPTYERICAEMGYDPGMDEMSVRTLTAVTQNSDLRDEDSLIPLIEDTVTVFGDSPGLESDISIVIPEGTLIAAGSATKRMISAGFRPDIIVTDLDGEISSQLEASSDGAVTVILAHGDNADLIREYAPQFKGPIVLTTQGEPRGNVLDFGGFTDGDRAVCMAREFGAQKIILVGFDFDTPSPKTGRDPAVKLSKLSWAKKIIFANGGNDIILPKPI